MTRTFGWASGFVVLAASLAAAQPPAGGAGQRGGQPPPPMTNLQIIPKDTPRPQVIATMQSFTQALGVQCAYCHIDEGRGGRQDFAADDKPTKKTARQMMILARDINDKLPAVVSKTANDTTRVGCSTCHHGLAIPKQLSTVLATTVTDKSLEAAVAQYRELRTKYYGSAAYDFSEGSLVSMAQQAIAADRADNALAWLNLNLEFYPKSSRTYQIMAQAHQRKNDKDTAIRDLEKAVELDPNNTQAKTQLQQLKGQ
jgi:photosynthetic reaction center cytochrome c subunit/tetratricopeptide repeat protein